MKEHIGHDEYNMFPSRHKSSRGKQINSTCNKHKNFHYVFGVRGVFLKKKKDAKWIDKDFKVNSPSYINYLLSHIITNIRDEKI